MVDVEDFVIYTDAAIDSSAPLEGRTRRFVFLCVEYLRVLWSGLRDDANHALSFVSIMILK